MLVYSYTFLTMTPRECKFVLWYWLMHCTACINRGLEMYLKLKLLHISWHNECCIKFRFRLWKFIKGWLKYRKPSVALLLPGYSHTWRSSPSHQVPVSHFAAHCRRRLERISKTGAKKGLRKPTIDEVEMAQVGWCHHTDDVVLFQTMTFRYIVCEDSKPHLSRRQE